MTFSKFKAALLSIENPEEMEAFVEKAFLHGLPFIFKKREDEYYNFRKKIAKKFDVSFHEVLIVGSAKFGFSYLKSGRKFDLNSDVDVVIVNERLFNKYYKAIAEYQYENEKLQIRLSQEEEKDYYKFLRYLIKGWLRPDLLPQYSKMKFLKTDWFDYFHDISFNKSEVGNYKVAAGLYKDWEYLKDYCTFSLEKYIKSISVNN